MNVRVQRRFYIRFRFEKNNLAESVTFCDYGFLHIDNITYYKYIVYKARSQGNIQFLSRESNTVLQFAIIPFEYFVDMPTDEFYIGVI